MAIFSSKGNGNGNGKGNGHPPAHNPAGETLTLEPFREDIEKNISQIQNNTMKELTEDLIDDSTAIREIVPVITISQSVFAVKGDISIIGGLPKVGKTSVCSFLLATALMKEIPEGFDTLGIRSTFCEGRPVVYIDTEQPQAYTNKLRKTILKLLGQANHPKNLYVLNLRKYRSDIKLEKVKRWMDELKDAHLWIIDGIADLIKDPNDTKEAFGIIEEMMIRSNDLDTAIVMHIHENPGAGGNGKLRGNLGSEAERKCGGAITIKKIKEKGIHAIEAKMIRGSADFDPIFFRYDPALGRMVSLDAQASEEIRRTTDKAVIKETKLRELAKACLLLGSMKYAELYKTIMEKAPQVEGKKISERTAKERIKEMLDKGFITITGEFYVYAG